VKRRKRNWMTSARLGITRGASDRELRAAEARMKARPKLPKASKTASGGRSDLESALRNLGYGTKARQMAAAARGSDFDSQLRDALRRNPRVLPEMTGEQLAAIDKYLRGQAMAQKKNSKKKRTRKGRMPAGLKAYWDKKRSKNSRSKPAKKTRRKKRNPRTRVRARTVVKVKYRYRARPKVKRARRRKSNPRPRAAKRINLKGFTSGQLKRVASAIRRATGKRVRIVKP
jgi:hypothetical protein